MANKTPRMSTRRKLAIASWSSPSEGNIYGKLTLDATEAVAYIEHQRRTTGEKVTITHLVGKAVGEALRQEKTLNGFIRLGAYVPHETVDVSFLVALEEGGNLAKAKVANVDQKSVVDIARELRELAARLHRGHDQEFNKTQSPIRMLPTWLLKPMLYTTGLLTASFGVSVPSLGLEAFPFGACIITSVGMFGLDEGYAPPTPFARVPAYVLVGALRDSPAVVDGKLAVRKQLTLTATLDHRFIDGHQAGTLARVVRQAFENPWTLDGLPGRPAEAGSPGATENSRAEPAGV
ncbi:2-oxo acid dehydrogenase subunit E2 [Chondromyces apiculatus]|uniref:2-oxo acid dehydrogenase acyltransferase catalytic domain protein n=1 Tax=Chondromyces apiculatus DSM 436 TaxID=1192034 RepID=A0A017T0N5_9BACT|nr:2-oxo acid dehydrogenase subunit E2 [Chondromyces apiculatus]EYF02091.1 2-oxo acid dehydrogenase acyltransferase catalytic domain protein [Chondromyces apiculatus DSM 436]